MENKKGSIKVGTLISGILTIGVSFVLFVLSFLILTAGFGSFTKENPWLVVATFGLVWIIYLIFAFFVFGFAVVILISGIRQIAVSTKKGRDFKYSKGSYIFFFVFDGILIFSCFGLSPMFGEQAIPMLFAAASVLIFCVIIKIIDLIVNNAKVKKGTIIEEEHVDTNNIKIEGLTLENIKKIGEVGNTKSRAAVAADVEKKEGKEAELDRIKKLKEKGIISADEYNILKREINNKD